MARRVSKVLAAQRHTQFAAMMSKCSECGCGVPAGQKMLGSVHKHMGKNGIPYPWNTDVDLNEFIATCLPCRPKVFKKWNTAEVAEGPGALTSLEFMSPRLKSEWLNTEINKFLRRVSQMTEGPGPVRTAAELVELQGSWGHLASLQCKYCCESPCCNSELCPKEQKHGS